MLSQCHAQKSFMSGENKIVFELKDGSVVVVPIADPEVCAFFVQKVQNIFKRGQATVPFGLKAKHPLPAAPASVLRGKELAKRQKLWGMAPGRDEEFQCLVPRLAPGDELVVSNKRVLLLMPSTYAHAHTC